MTARKYTFLAIMLVSCGQQKKPNPQTQIDQSAKIPGNHIYQNSTLVSALEDSTAWSDGYKIASGVNTVFEYYHNDPGSELVADDEFEQAIAFEIEGGLTEFNYRDETIVKTKCLFVWTCFCGPPGDENFTIDQGTLVGKKINDSTWDVSIALDLPSSVIKPPKINTQFKVINGALK